MVLTYESIENGQFSTQFVPSQSSLDESRCQIKNFVFLRKIKLFEEKNNITFLVLIRTTFMQKMSEIPVF